MPKYEWRSFSPVDAHDLADAIAQLHQAIQNVASVGRLYLPKSHNDETATLNWVPGLNRIAGKWVNGSQVFRSSISLMDFSIYVVDRQVQTIASLNLEGHTFRQSLIWLEEQIGRLGLDPTHLADAPPYELAPSAFLVEPFKKLPLDTANFVSALYHNSFAVLLELATRHKWKGEILIWPQHFDQATTEILRDTGSDETNTTITYGMSPGDAFIDGPYFYVSSWPHIEVGKMKLLPIGKWVEDDWTGAILPIQQLIQKRNQRSALINFFENAASQIRGELLR